MTLSPALRLAEHQIERLTAHRNLLIDQLERLRDALEDGYQHTPEGRAELVRIQNAIYGHKP